MVVDRKILYKLIIPLIVIACSTVFMCFRFGIASIIFTLPSGAGLIFCFWVLILLHHLRTKTKTGLKNLSLYLAVVAGLINIIHTCILLYYSGLYNRPGSALDMLGYLFMQLYTSVYMIAAYFAGCIIETLIRATVKSYRQEDINSFKTAYEHLKKNKLIYTLLVFVPIAYIALQATIVYLPSTGFIPLSDIHYAAQLGSIKQVERFLNKGVDINVREDDDYKDTPLHVAAFHGQDRIVEYLVSKGALIEARNAIGRTPLHTAARGGATSTIGLLIELGAEINAQDKNGNTPLRESARFGNFENVKLFVNSGADINLPNNMNQTPLFQAVWYAYEDVTKYLLEKGANVNLTDKKGRTLLGIAREEKFKNIEQLLLEHGAKE